MSSSSSILRERARRLRRLATHVPLGELDGVLRRAGEDTWIGPTAARCVSEIVDARRMLTAVCDDLRRAASELEREADRLDIVAAAAGARR